MIAYLVLAALQTAAVPATTAPAAASTPSMVAAAAPVKTASANPDDKIVCEEQEETGTRLGGHKVCHTKRDWREIHNQDRDAVRHAQDDRGYVHY